MNEINVAILVSWRFECLNLYLDVLKNNFPQNFITHVFCNLSADSLKSYNEQIDHSLIDFFYPICDENCKENVNVSTGHKQDVKRRQPLEAITTIMSTMANNDDVGNFIYTECDIYPLDSSKYLKPYHDIPISGAVIRYIPTFNPKLPAGYMSPGPIYVSSHAAQTLANKLVSNKQSYLMTGVCFEGMLAAAVNELANEGTSFNIYSDYHTGNKTYDKDLEPVTLTTHQHNIFNLEDAFLKHNIKNGKWVTLVLEGETLKMAWEIVDDSYTPGGVLQKTPGFQIGFMEKWDSTK